YDDGDTHWRKSTKSALGAGNSQIAPFSSKLFICTHKILQRASTTLNHRFEPDLASTDADAVKMAKAMATASMTRDSLQALDVRPRVATRTICWRPEWRRRRFRA